MKITKIKYVITIICIIMFISVGIIAYKNKSIFSNHGTEMNTDNAYNINLEDKSDKNSPQNKIVLNGELKLDVSQIYAMNTEALEKKKINDSYYELSLTATDCSCSKNLDSRYSFKTTYWNRYGKDTFNEDGTITGDYYYLYVDYTVSCKRGEAHLVPKAIRYIVLNNDTLEYDDKLDTSYIYLDDYDNRFGKEYMISQFNENDLVHFQLVYLVPDSIMDDADKNICVYYENGTAGIASIKGDNDNAKNFIKLDIKK